MQTIKIFILFLVLVTFCFSWTDLGGGVCTCNSCGDCEDALNDTTDCYDEVRLTQDISTSGTCINDPSNFDNKIFDCQGHSISSTSGSGDGIYISEQSNNIIRNCITANFTTGFGISHSSKNTTLINNTAYNNSNDGFYIRIESNATLINNTAYNNSNDGFRFWGTDSSILINNTAYDNGRYGFYLQGDSTLTNNTAHNNQYGARVLGGVTTTTITNDHYYNNMVHCWLDYPGNTNLSRVIFDSPLGNLTNHTELSLYDASPGFTIDYAIQPAPLPEGYISFAGKFVDITESVAPPGQEVSVSEILMDKATWHWDDSELLTAEGMYDESAFELWVFEELVLAQGGPAGAGEWSLLNDTPDTESNTLSVFAPEPQSVYAILYNASMLPLPPSDGEEEKKEEPSGKLSVAVSMDCDMNIVTVTDGGDPVEGADVTVINAGILSGTTDSNGEFSFEGCGHSAVIYVNADGYPPKSISEDLIDCAVCEAGCEMDEDCPDSMECAAEVCVPVECECGTVENHQCVEYACCADDDCLAGQTCENHLCTPEFECTTDNDCEGTEYCNIAPGAAGGTCEPVTGECGYVQAHTWVQYECGDETGCASCPQGEVCEDNKCKAGDIDCPAVSYLDEEGTCTATVGPDLCANCDYQVIDPAGEWFTGKTDENGSILLPFDLEGEYKVALLKDGEIVNEVTVNVLPEAPPEEPGKPVEEAAEDALSWLWLLVVLAVLAVAFLYWRQKKGVKPKKK